jgi:hypothetical protein
MAYGSLRVFLVLLVVQVCLLVAMAASAVQGRLGVGPLMVEWTPEVCCPYHPDCCRLVQANTVSAAPSPGP